MFKLTNTEFCPRIAQDLKKIRKEESQKLREDEDAKLISYKTLIKKVFKSIICRYGFKTL